MTYEKKLADQIAYLTLVVATKHPYATMYSRFKLKKLKEEIQLIKE